MIHVVAVTCVDGYRLLSRDMLMRLGDDGYVFGRLLFGGEGFAPTGLFVASRVAGEPSTVDLSAYHVTVAALDALTFVVRTQIAIPSLVDAALALEPLGGFHTLDALLRHERDAAYNPMTPAEDHRGVYMWRVCSQWSVPEAYSVTQPCSSCDVYARCPRELLDLLDPRVVPSYASYSS